MTSTPNNVVKTAIEYRSRVIDTLGRCSFFLNWVDTKGRVRSQVFFADPILYGHKRPNE